MPKFRTAAVLVPTLATVAEVPAARVLVVPIVTVAEPSPCGPCRLLITTSLVTIEVSIVVVESTVETVTSVVGTNTTEAII
jgi:hypothetical protein